MLKSITLIAILLMSAGQAYCETLTVTATGLKTKGGIMIALFNSEEGYKTNKPIKAQKLNVTKSTVILDFTVSPGTYAIKSYHDINNNGKLDFNPLGMPSEPFAFSNKAKGNMGPPSFKSASFKVEGDTAHQLIYK